jgi:hypothetical protein
VFAIGGTIGIGWIGMWCMILLWCQQFTVVAFLEFDDIGFAERCSYRDQFLAISIWPMWLQPASAIKIGF